MSSNIWTRAALSSELKTRSALSSEAKAATGRCWRAVEAQYHASTMKITDTVEEQRRLEQLVEASKPKVPEECRHLHFLLATPFRYGAPYPHGSRFRRAGLTPGVFYASEAARTAIVEIAFYRLLFFADSPATPWPTNAGEYTTFAVEYEAARAIDLTVAPFNKYRTVWTNPIDYAVCQDLADAARAEGISLIKYQSARDPDRGLNLAILSCRAFARPDEVDRRTWRIQLSSSGCRAICEMPNVTVDLGRDAFSADPRNAGIKWDR
jgi:hypothetical protein